MESLWILIPLSVLIAFCIGIIFWWAAGNGQFDDLDGPGQRILIDDDSPPLASKVTQPPASPKNI